MKNWITEAGISITAIYAVWVAKADELWIDEEITIELVQRWDLIELLVVLPVIQPHFPTYYLLPELFGIQLTLIIGAISLPVTAVLTKRIADTLHDNGLIAGFLVAVSPFLAIQAGWLRMYGLLTMFMTAGIYFTITERNRLSTAAFIASLSLHVFGIFGLAWHAVIRRDRNSIAAFSIGSALLALYLIRKLFKPPWSSRPAAVDYTGVGHAVAPNLIQLLQLPIATVVGAPMSMPLPIWKPLFVSFFVVGSIFALYRSDRRLLLWILAPIIMIAVASHLIHPVYRVKYFGFIAPAVAVCLTDNNKPSQQQIITAMIVGGLLAFLWIARVQGGLLARRMLSITGTYLLNFYSVAIVVIAIPIILFIVGLWALRDGPMS